MRTIRDREEYKATKNIENIYIYQSKRLIEENALRNARSFRSSFPRKRLRIDSLFPIKTFGNREN